MRPLVFYAQYSIMMMRMRSRLLRNGSAYGVRYTVLGKWKMVRVTANNVESLWQLLRIGWER